MKIETVTGQARLVIVPPLISKCAFCLRVEIATQFFVSIIIGTKCNLEKSETTNSPKIASLIYPLGILWKFTKPINFMHKDTAIWLKNAQEYAGKEARIYEDYSGRGMFGKTTTGLVVDDLATLFLNSMNFIKENPACSLPDFTMFRRDNLGHDTIIY